MKRQAAIQTHAAIWRLALGYFAFYIPYSGLTTALARGMVPGTGGPVSGLLILPATAVATSALLLAHLYAIGSLQRIERRRVLGFAVPVPSRATLVSGVATAVIIATTTLNYTFPGMSIVLALVLMRGGVMLLAPLVDRLSGRRVKALSWVAFAFSLLAIAIVFLDVRSDRITRAAGLSITAYLAGYLVRLRAMSILAKSGRPTVDQRYFAEETLAAAVALVVLPAIVALVGLGPGATALRAGFRAIMTLPVGISGLTIGALYAGLYVFGSWVYLDRRENTFCIPLNRCASVMSGVVSSYALTFFLGLAPPSLSQLVAATIIMVTLATLMASTVGVIRGAIRATAQRTFLFVCSGNTSRSPIAQAICNDEIARRLGIDGAWGETSPIRAVSAGLTVTAPKPFSAAAVRALRAFGIPVHTHVSRPVTSDLIAEAELVFCMTKDQQHHLVARFPYASAKIHCLDSDRDIEDPSMGGEHAYSALVTQLRQLIRLEIASVVM